MEINDAKILADINNQQKIKQFPNPNVMKNYATPKRIIVRDLSSNTEATSTFARYSREQITSYLKAPDKNEKALRDMSIYLYNISNQYKILINYFSNMPTFDHIIAPLAMDTSKASSKNILAQYNKAKKYIENMNISHAFSQALTVVFREDVFYSYINETPDSFVLQKLDANYCKLLGRIDGCWYFGFDFQYFTGKEAFLELYPIEFQTKYRAYQSDNKLRWQELDPKNTICLKFHEDLNYCIPPFTSLFSDIADIQEYKDLTKVGSELENYKLVHLKLPYDKEGTPILDADLAKDYYTQFGNSTPEQVGVAMSPFDVEDLKFEKSNVNSSDDVRSAEDRYWRAAGVNTIMFGGGKDPSAAAVKISVIVDQAIVFRMLRQIERNINRLLKDLSGTQKFNIEIMDVTYYNKEEYFNELLKAGQYGIPVRSKLSAILGSSQSNMEGLLYLENTMLNLPSQETPLSSSNTQSANVDGAGRPTNESQGGTLDTAGEQTQDGNTNANR